MCKIVLFDKSTLQFKGKLQISVNKVKKLRKITTRTATDNLARFL